MIKISRAKCNDVIDLENCNRSCLPISYSFLEYIYFINNPSYLVLKATYDDKIIGYIIGYAKRHNQFHIMSFGVHKGYRGKKIGYSLMNRIERLAKRRFPKK